MKRVAILLSFSMHDYANIDIKKSPEVSRRNSSIKARPALLDTFIRCICEVIDEET